MSSTRTLKLQRRRGCPAGFTLVEMITVIAITAVIAAVVAVFIRVPLQAYQDAQRRSVITDAADTVFARIKRDLQTALPNSIRLTTTGAGANTIYYLEFLPAVSAGRYRIELATVPNGACAGVPGDAGGEVLVFGASDTCFTTLGNIPSLASISITSADYLVIYNLGPGFDNADAYAGGASGNRSPIVSVAAGSGGENIIQFNAHNFTLESPGRRFYVTSTPVSFVCDPNTGTLSRISGYAIAAAQATPPVGTSVPLAMGISACTITYDQNVVNQRNSIVSIWLSFSDPNATAVNLFQQVQVGNAP